MSKQRRRFSSEFKAEAVQIYLSSDRSQDEVANELGISATSLSKWVLKHRKSEEQAKYPGETADQKVARLEKENAILKQERDILKKSLGIVSKQ